MRVVSRSPCPASPTAASLASDSRAARSDEMTCGTCEDESDTAVVLGGIQLYGNRAEVERERLDGGVRRPSVGDAGVVGDHPWAADKQVGPGGDRSPAFAAGHRMGADIARDSAPMARSSPSGASFTLATSVTSASGYAASSAATVWATTSGGVHTTIRRRRITGGGGTTCAVVDGQSNGRGRDVGEDHLDVESTKRGTDTGAEQAGPDYSHRTDGSRSVMGRPLPSGSSSREVSAFGQAQP